MVLEENLGILHRIIRGLFMNIGILHILYGFRGKAKGFT